jgi:Sigma-70 region 2
MLATSTADQDGTADDAVRRLYARHARALQGYVGQFCPDPASAEDIVQETFIRAWRHLPQLSTGGPHGATGAIREPGRPGRPGSRHSNTHHYDTCY